MTGCPCRLAVALAVLAALSAFADDPGKKARAVRLPLTDVQAGCCEAAVEKAMKDAPAVEEIAFEKGKDATWAVVTLKKTGNLSLAKVEEALAKATKAMGKGMGLTYALDRKALQVDSATTFLTGPVSDDAKAALDKALGELKGFEKSDVVATKAGSRVTFAFAKESDASLEKVSKALKDAKIEVKDVEFAGAVVDGAREGKKDAEEGEEEACHEEGEEGEGSGCCGE